MANLNKVMLSGRLTRDPETRHTPSGQSVTNFGIAVNRTYRKKDSDEKVEETTFVDVEAWGQAGETFARYMKKGRQAYVEGRLKLDSWEKNGEKRSKLTVVMEEFQFLDGGANGGGGGAGGYAGSSNEGGAPRRRAAPAGAPASAASGGGAAGGAAGSGET